MLPLTVSRLDSQAPDWPEQVQALRSTLGADHNPNLLPPQFVFATMREIGGDILQWHSGPHLLAAGIRLTTLDTARTKRHLICYHLAPAGRAAALSPSDLQRTATHLFADTPIQMYDGAGTHAWPTPAVLETVDGITYGPPSVADTAAIRQLQSTIWQAADTYLYPTYIHDPDFSAAWSLVAHYEGQLLGFLVGFLHDGAVGPLPPALSAKPGTVILESLLLGIHPDYRARNIAFHLKRIQAVQAQQRGIHHIQWVVDPLQYRNARLNLGRLGAVSGQFLRDYLPFRNALNQVHASRLRLMWPLQSTFVQQVLQTTHRAPLNLNELATVGVVNEGLDRVRLNLTHDWLAVEIPNDWDSLQRTHLSLAQQWRDMTDEVLAHYLGTAGGPYLITHIGHRDDRVYLVAERIRPDLVARYEPDLRP